VVAGLSSPAAAAIAYVQSKSSASGSPQSSISATFTSAQTAGNLIVVAVGWTNGTSVVTSVTDSRGNTYALAIGPTVFTGTRSSSIYYAKNIVSASAGANTVRVTFSSSVPFPDLRMAEYSGLDTTNPLDVAAGAAGTGTACSSGAATTTSANDLLIGADDLSGTTTAPGSGFTQRQLSSNGHILEDRIVSTVGSYSATATQNASGSWVMQMAAFRAAGTAADTQAPTAPTNLSAAATTSTRINLTWTAATDNVGVTGYRIERCQGASCTAFVQIAAPTSASFSDTSLSASTTYRYRVRAADAAGNLGNYSNVAAATTQSAADTQAPTAPTGLTATVSSNQVDLSWTASADNVGVTAYLIERCQGSGCTSFSQIASTANTSYSNTGLSASTTYVYRVRAADAAMNLSGYSGTATATVAVALAASQANSAAPQTTTSSVAATFIGAQTAGDTNVVAIGWRTPTVNVQSITDTRGNVYVLAVGPTILPGIGAHALYYSSGISAAAAGGNAVTVPFSAPVALPDVRIAEYSGIDTSAPVDTIATATGNSAISDSGTIATFAPNAVIVAANLTTTLTTGAGTGFTARAISNPNGNILEDRVVSAAGTYNATAPLSSAGPWIMQVAAFRWIASPPCD
jgi:chitodextrinase